ncbi:MAG TPA: cation diffusion facilitator family transporter [Burkholderiales bacterium]|nr:cation diffusion facilitator family transporter [Burkholderiales bacterium]
MSAHAHPHHHGHAHDHGEGPPAYALALSITLAYAIVELAGGLMSGSLALASDAGHMFSDALALALAAGAAWVARRPPGLKHSYGLARAEVIGATLNGLIMLGIIVLLVVEAVQRLLDPRPVTAVAVMVIAAIGLLVNIGVMFVLSRGHSDLNSRAAMIHVLGDLVSSLAALIAGAVVYVTDWVLIDPILSLLIAVLILVTTLRLLRDTLHVLMEGVPSAFDMAQIGGALARVAGVVTVHDLHIWSIGSERAALSAHVDIERLEDWPRILQASREMLHAEYGIDHVTLQPELVDPRPQRATVTVWPRGQRPS